MVFLDAFTSAVPPFQLTTKQAVARMHDATGNDGIVVANIVTTLNGPGSGLLQAFVATYQTEFSQVAVYPVTPRLSSSTIQNVMLIATSKPLDKATFDKVTRANPEFRAMVAAQVHVPSKSGKILTDDFAPVEQLAVR